MLDMANTFQSRLMLPEDAGALRAHEDFVDRGVQRARQPHSVAPSSFTASNTVIFSISASGTQVQESSRLRSSSET